MRNALELLIMKAEGNPKVKAILFNVNLQITLPKDVAQGVLDAVEARKPNLLMLGVIRGTGAERAFKMLEKTPVKLCRDAKEAKSLLVSQLGR